MRIPVYLALFAALSPALAGAEPISLGPTDAPGTLAGTESNCAPTYLHADGSYEYGGSWRTGGVAPPDYGAFAEEFEGTKNLCAFVADLTQDGYFENGQTADFFLWDNQSGAWGDEPGNVLFVLHDVSPWPIAIWPEITRVVVPLVSPTQVEGKWWVGIWGNWPGEMNAWFMAFDTNGPSTRVPMTNNIANGFPPGWVPVSEVWTGVVALGLGVEGTPLTPAGVDDSPVQAATFGRVKSLYR